MANNTISIDFESCEPQPANGFKIFYRPVGSEVEYREAPSNFTDSPAEWVDTLDPLNTLYEGYIQGDCGGGKLGPAVSFVTELGGGGSGSSSSDGSASSGGGSSVGPGPCRTLQIFATEFAVGSADFDYIDCEGNPQSGGVTPGSSVIICAQNGSVVLEQPEQMSIGLLAEGCEIMPIAVKVGAIEMDTCVNPETVVYLAPPNADITTGLTVYSDVTLTSPLTGFSFITNLAGTIFNMDSGTGVVGSPTGNAC